MSLEFEGFSAEPVTPAAEPVIEVFPTVPDIRVRRSRAAFFILALVAAALTLGGLTYLWGRVLLMVVMPVADKMPPTVRERMYAGIFVALIGLCISLTWLLARLRPSKAA